MDEVLVSIICITYNHERYIAQALDGMLMQDVSFKYEILINDDASTDRTADVIKEYEKQYPGIIKAFYQDENLYSKGVKVLDYLLRFANGKYIAICEGDDFWIDRNKLQTQIDFMEKHLDCALTVHSGFYAYENGVIEKKPFRLDTKNRYVSVEEIISHWIAPTASIVYRKSARGTSDIPFLGNLKIGDYPLLVYLSLNGSVYFFSREMCAYRRGSVSSVSKEYQSGEKKVNHNQEIIELLNRIDTYSGKKYSSVIIKAQEERRFQNYILKGQIDVLKKTEIYRDLSPINKAKLFLKITCPFYNCICKLNNAIKLRIRYYIDLQRTRLMKMYNIVILK